MKRILIIEDEPEMLRNLATILRLEKFHPLSAEDGRLGVDLAKKQKPDLILCDVAMPGLDGYGVIAALRAVPGAAPGRSSQATSPRVPPSNSGATSPIISARSLERCQTARSSRDRKFRMMVHSLLSGCMGGTKSLLMNPGNRWATALCRACHALKSSSPPVRSLAVAIRTAGALIGGFSV
jgi:CheY-like chemotaxis protein